MPLVAAGFGQEEIINALFVLQDEKLLELIDGNLLTTTKAAS